ncbi:Magnesium transporter MgtE [Porphyridium purpureum]|uniref:Magnesium transporter MgtE n=1 Tax=Porphyridium purpureum TaxID=35688 RepID=A0A5J4Z1P0_PORPP|nr:Magnesium transporter MgtE [Porphyridium purpureum]|eukprot:POR1285..scf295_1
MTSSTAGTPAGNGKPSSSPARTMVGGIGVVPLGANSRKLKMRREAMTVPADYSIQECVDFLRSMRDSDIHDQTVSDSESSVPVKAGIWSEPLANLYVLESSSGSLLGYVHIEDLLLAKDRSRAMVTMLRPCQLLLQEVDSLESAARKMRSSNVTIAPVVDDENRIIGVLTADDLVQEMELEASEEFYRFGGVSSGLDQDTGSEAYLDVPVLTFVKKRTMWLCGLLLLQSLSSVVLRNYQPLIEANVILAIFLTTVSGTGGNAGNQSSALIIRGLATGEITRDMGKSVLLREVLVGFLMSAVLGLVAFMRVFFTSGMTLQALGSALTISFALMITVVFSTFFGSAMPLLFERIGVDPAWAGSVCSVCVDIAGALILCQTAAAMLR